MNALSRLANVALVLLIASPPALADDKPDELKLSKVEQKILDLTNAARAKEKLPALTVDAKLMKAARDHSANMAKQKKMDHVLDGKKPNERVKAVGYDYSTMGENVAYGFNSSLDKIFQGWMDSKGHRENILAEKYEQIGIGSAKNADGEIYYTQVFGTPKKKP